VTTDGRWISIPVVRDQNLMFYRKDFLKLIGETKPPSTWDQLRDYSLRLKKLQGEGKIGKDVAICAFPLGRSSDAAGWYEMIKYAYGSLLVKKDGKTVVFDSPQTLEALKMISTLFSKDQVIPEGAAGWDDNTNNSLWYAGKAGFTFNTPSITFMCKRNAPDVWKLTGTAMVPGGPGGRGFFSTDRTFASLKNEKRPDLVKDFLLYFFTEENMKKFMTFAEGTYSPVLKSLADLPIYKKEENAPLIGSINDARYPGWPGPVTRPAVEVYSRRLTADMVGRVTIDKISPEAAVKETTKKIEEIYSKFK
jgi:multiple sugar transport system substrate-binding protein